MASAPDVTNTFTEQTDKDTPSCAAAEPSGWRARLGNVLRRSRAQSAGYPRPSDEMDRAVAALRSGKARRRWANSRLPRGLRRLIALGLTTMGLAWALKVAAQATESAPLWLAAAVSTLLAVMLGLAITAPGLWLFAQPEKLARTGLAGGARLRVAVVHELARCVSSIALKTLAAEFEARARILEKMPPGLIILVALLQAAARHPQLEATIQGLSPDWLHLLSGGLGVYAMLLTRNAVHPLKEDLALLKIAAEESARSRRASGPGQV